MTIHGIGVDIVSIKRIENIVKKYKNKFLNNTFSQEELRYCLNKPNIYQHLAGRFAAKEAVFKALGGNFITPIKKFKYIEILQDTFTGAPEVKLSGPLESLRARLQISSIHLSISHCREYAVAYVICVK